MQVETINLPKRATWVLATAALGAVWNTFGVVQFIGSLSQSRESLMAGGMTAAQVEIYAGLPLWMTLVFAFGVFGGLIGSLFLGLRLAVSRAIFAVSLAAYVLLFIGDVYYGVFAAIPSQFVIISFVVVVSAGLLWTSDRAYRQGHFA